LDTQVVLWWVWGDGRLSDELRLLLKDEPDVYISPVSVWEIAIKQAKGKLPGPVDLAERATSEFTELPVTAQHAIAAGRLPRVHEDPFDRMLIAQARCEGLTLVSSDEAIHKYDVNVHWS
jgi:PIN domain nuclease of toxin-antitoxin system